MKNWHTHHPRSQQGRYNRDMKNTHLEHLEDEILNSGTAGGFNAVTFLRQFSDMLSGKKTDLSITTKWDGAPAIVCGTEPVSGRFFVGTKSVFNKVNPKICFDDTDVDRFYKGALASKLKDCLKYLPQVNISGIVQGDLLYTQEDKISGIVGGNRVICFTLTLLLTLLILLPVKVLESVSPRWESYFIQFIRATVYRLQELYRKNKHLSILLLRMFLLPVRILLMPLVLLYLIKEICIPSMLRSIKQTVR